MTTGREFRFIGDLRDRSNVRYYIDSLNIGRNDIFARRPGEPEPLPADEAPEAVAGAEDHETGENGSGRADEHPGSGSDDAAADDTVTESLPVDGDGGYVPMSEWLDDFDRR